MHRTCWLGWSLRPLGNWYKIVRGLHSPAPVPQLPFSLQGYHYTPSFTAFFFPPLPPFAFQRPSSVTKLFSGRPRINTFHNHKPIICRVDEFHFASNLVPRSKFFSSFIAGPNCNLLYSLNTINSFKELGAFNKSDVYCFVCV